MQKVFPLLMMAVILVSCGVKDNQKESAETPNTAIGLWDKAVQFRENENIDQSVSTLMLLIRDFGDSEEAVKAQFQIAEIYLNDVQDYELAIVHFRKVMEKYKENDMAIKALFMVGYIQANYLQAYSDAINNYNTFIANHPDHELVPSVNYELDALKDIQAEIDSLNDLAKSK